MKLNWLFTAFIAEFKFGTNPRLCQPSFEESSPGRDFSPLATLHLAARVMCLISPITIKKCSR